MGSTDAKTFPGQSNICLLLSCFAVQPGRLPGEMPGVKTVLGWLLSKRPAAHSFMGADQTPFVLLCRDYLNVRVMVYQLVMRTNDGGGRRYAAAELSFDTHPEDPGFEEEWGPCPPPTAVRRVVFSNSHFVRVNDDDDAQEDGRVQRALRQFSDHVSPSSLDLLWRDLNDELHRRMRMRNLAAEAEERRRRQQQQQQVEHDAHMAAALAREEEERVTRVRAETEYLIAVQRAEDMAATALARKRRQMEEEDANMAAALAIADQEATSLPEMVA